MVSNFQINEKSTISPPKPSQSPPKSEKVDEQPQASVESLKNQIQQRSTQDNAPNASPRQTAQSRGRLNAQSYRQFTALGANSTGSATGSTIGSTTGHTTGSAIG